ncbi:MULTISPECIES: hypothetical protein [Cellvibrio]|jgi:hypothetical protein|uniref:Uncharacterized protein n=1 Tax=Cellvibrio fibrivorans TaxID=126350 RepID=A0ABU1UUR2_9GAMM|nr:hypothetical protein [Cellvibrio fibrivorans]MDR7088938.1 hypothetical protein [Cellvibrio fibrivorans]
MEKLDRNALKNKFKKGRMPSEQDFSNLIDSMVNILEEGFDKTSRDGLKISQLMGSGRLLSFYKNIAVESPQWFLELSTSENKLHFGTPQSPRVLSLYSQGSGSDGQNNLRVAVGINKENPQTTLDVEGTIASSGRMGKVGDMAAPADGEWHDITSALTGCEAFEVVAGVGGQDADGKYALVHAIALNTFNGKSSINTQDAHFGNKCNRLELRWQPVPEQGQFHFKLQIRAQCSYGKNIWINYHITRLWFDPLMLESSRAPE